MSDPLIGKRLDEYTLEKLLGQGGMARVYRALDTGLHRYAAIKVIDTPHQHNEAYIARFEREAQAIAQLNHPHIVTLYRYGNSDNLLYLAMQYIKGADLHAVLNGYERDREFMEFGDVVRLLGEIGSAIDYAHSQGVIHRDVKPSNILLDAEGRAYLSDFGLALLTEVGTLGNILGSPRYIAPEQAASSAGAVNESDVYSLGVILYRMLTGRVPFEHGDTLGLLTQHMTADPPAPRQLRPEISPALETIVLRALAKKPGDRYATGREMAEAVEREMVENGESIAFPSTVTSLSIIDRVALDMEAIPPPIVTMGTVGQGTPPTASSPAEWTPTAPLLPGSPGPVPAGKRPLPLRWMAGGIFLLLLLAVAWLLFSEGSGEAVEAVSLDPSPGATVSEGTGSTEVAEVRPPSPEATLTRSVVTVVAEVLPTEPGVPEPTNTPQPELNNPTPTLAPTTAPTGTPAGPRLMMFYDPTSFYLYNPNRDMDIRVSGLLFESLDEQGELSGYWLEGGRWSQFYSFLEEFGCVSLEVAGERVGCDRHNAGSLTPPSRRARGTTSFSGRKERV